MMPSIIALVVLSAAATLVSAGARHFTLFELASHFRVQYLVVQVLGAALLLAAGRPRWAFIAVVAALPNLWIVGPYLPGLLRTPQAANAAPAPITVVGLNLYYATDVSAATRAYLGQRQPDVLVLTEFTPRWSKALHPDLARRYPHHIRRPRWTPMGMAVYSRFPLTAVEDLRLDEGYSEQLRMQVRAPQGDFELYALHLTSPTRRGQADQRNLQLRRLAKILADADPRVPRMVVGDLNLTPYSPWFGMLLERAALSDGRRPFGLHFTWPTWPVPLWIPIDHCLVNAGVTVLRVAAGPRTDSDHLPLECEISLSSAGSARRPEPD